MELKSYVGQRSWLPFDYADVMGGDRKDIKGVAGPCGSIVLVTNMA
jgi:hypothetical protein